VNNRIYIGPQPVSPARPSTLSQPRTTAAPQGTDSFQAVLNRALAQPVKFSGHAQERLAASKRQLSEVELAKLSDAVDRAAQKGARDALVLMQDLALVVSVKNRTVITAVDGDRMKENIFTNIDSAVIL
jgi:flagellar operon protein